MKRILLCLLLACSFLAKAQLYNNEWIDFTNTYYKFKVGRTGLYRISQSALAAAGLGSGWAEQFQLWRNGVQVPIYTSTASGPLSAADYIEFWGEMNDGKPDKDLYRSPDYQLNDKWSLETDSATYFLTITSAVTRRLENTPNNIAGNTLAAEPYFMHTVGAYFRDRINGGYAVNVDNQYLYSSSYDKGEGWSSNDIASNQSHTLSFSNLQTYAAGPAATFSIGLSGNAITPRNYLVQINNDSIVGGDMDYYNYAKTSGNFSTSLLSSNNATVQVINVCNQSPCPSADRMVIHQYEIKYPRIFDFSGATNFEFALPATTVGAYLEIKNFNYGATAPVLYDLTNGKRYVADISVSPFVRVVLEPSATERRLVMVNEEASNINSVGSFQQRVFTNYSLTTNQGDYLIISNSLLFAGANGSNPVEDYRAYRASAAGGSYKARTYLIDELVDQFGYGIKKNPIAIRNFVRFARNAFAGGVKHVFLIGKGVEYTTQRYNEADPNIDRLNLVPTFGVPASDVLFTANPGSSLPEISIGRLSAVSAVEVSDYLQKVKQTEITQASLSPSIKAKAWMKNVLHFSGGGGEQAVVTLLANHMRDFNKIISDTLFGANVHSFSKDKSGTVDEVNNTIVPQLFEEGISLLTYFGHSSSTTFEFNIENPNIFNNPGKYPLFVALGCNAGNIFNASASRLSAKEAASDKYILTPNKGAIGFIASTHFGIVHYLGIWGNAFYSSLSNTDYGKTIGEILTSTAKNTFNITTEEDFYSRANVEELNLVGDPAVRVNPHNKPDYAIEADMVKSESFVSTINKFFPISVKVRNIGKSINKKLVLEVKHVDPNQLAQVVYRDTIQNGIDYESSFDIQVPVDELKDRGANKLVIKIDADEEIDELFETNNTVTKDYTVFENEARPVFPYNFSIINKQGIKLVASSADPFVKQESYRFEVDTTESFNSPIKETGVVTTKGGVIEFVPGTIYKDSTVYYWRVATVPKDGEYKWNSFSFIYLQNSSGGFNQSHFFQQTKSTLTKIRIDSTTRNLHFLEYDNSIFIQNGVYPTTSGLANFYKTVVNNIPLLGGGCAYNEIIISVFNPAGFQPWQNNYSGPTGLYGSLRSTCDANRVYNFEYLLSSAADRKKAMDFLDLIPNGCYVVIRSNTNPNFGSNTYVDTWKSDTAIFGSNNSLYHKLVNQGVSNLETFNTPRSWIFVYKKNDNQKFSTRSIFSQGIYDPITIDATCATPYTVGYVNSPEFGPASKWKELKWNGHKLDTNDGDNPKLSIIGIKESGLTDTLSSDITPTSNGLDVSFIDAKTYPYLKLALRNSDSINSTPYQLDYWQLIYDQVPEGAVAPNIFFQMKDTLFVGENLDFKLAFKNISDKVFDSLKVKMVITDKNNIQHAIPIQKVRPLNAGDTLHVSYQLDSKSFIGTNMLYLEVNPDNDQPEQYKFNNFIYHKFYVDEDSTNPFLDVTFDNVHILNRDIVSSKPEIFIKLKDLGSRLLLSDSSLVTVKVKKMSNGDIRTYQVDGDTLSFTPASQISENTASLVFKPYFFEDGEYELVVSGKDARGNKAGDMDYRVVFQVINKPMISNLLNYPNPFTTSTAFVFTLTGSEVPQNIKIQVLTVTGKIVREITKEELGSIRIGRNITEYKWNGTDQYGQKLANGVYLYRVVTNLNGKALDKYKSQDDNTDKYFNKGYGKMYLMR